VIAYLFLCRAWNALFAAAVCAYSFYIVRDNYEVNYYDAFFLSVGIFFLVAFANAHNDIIDCEIDKINRPNRPLPSGKISIRVAKISVCVLFFLTMFFSILAGFKFAILFFAAALLCLVYNRFLKSLPLVGNFTVALLTTLPVLIPMKFSILAFFAFMLTFAREIVKDIEDIEGDKSKNLKTLPLLVGINLSLALVFICLLQCILQIVLFKPILLVGVLPFMAFFAIFAFLRRWRLSQTMLKLSMLGGLLAFLLP